MFTRLWKVVLAQMGQASSPKVSARHKVAAGDKSGGYRASAKHRFLPVGQNMLTGSCFGTARPP